MGGYSQGYNNFPEYTRPPGHNDSHNFDNLIH